MKLHGLPGHIAGTDGPLIHIDFTQIVGDQRRSRHIGFGGFPQFSGIQVIDKHTFAEIGKSHAIFLHHKVVLGVAPGQQNF